MTIPKHVLESELSGIMDIEIELDQMKYDGDGNRIEYRKENGYFVKSKSKASGFYIDLVAELSELTDNKTFKITVTEMIYLGDEIHLNIDYCAKIKKALLQIFY